VIHAELLQRVVQLTVQPPVQPADPVDDPFDEEIRQREPRAVAREKAVDVVLLGQIGILT
jgi:hypothetical protein